MSPLARQRYLWYYLCPPGIEVCRCHVEAKYPHEALGCVAGYELRMQMSLTATGNPFRLRNSVAAPGVAAKIEEEEEEE